MKDPFIEAAFNGAQAAAASPTPTQSLTPPGNVTPGPNGCGFAYAGTPWPQPPVPPVPPPTHLYNAPPSICGTLSPGARITECLRVTAAEFDVTFWNVGGVYSVTSPTFTGKAFLVEKHPERLTFTSIDENGKTITFEIMAAELIPRRGQESYDIILIHPIG